MLKLYHVFLSWGIYFLLIISYFLDSPTQRLRRLPQQSANRVPSVRWFGVSSLGAVQEVGYFLNNLRNFMFFFQKTMKLLYLFQCPKSYLTDRRSDFSDTPFVRQ
jgi:uncharacterized protein (DUF486 family)